VQRLLPDVSPRTEYSDLVSILQSPSRWKEAHEQFTKIRVGITIPGEKTPEWSLERLFTHVAENAAKTAYNCSGESAPFDQASFDRLLQAEVEFLERKKNEANPSSQPTSLARRG
jgi:hypothetical protein